MRRLRTLLLTLSLLALAAPSLAQMLTSEGFVPNPTKTSQASGNWATGATWVGGSAPATDEVFVTIASGTTVTIAEGTSIKIQTLYMAPGSTLINGRGTTVTISNLIYRDTAGVNPQFETGIINLGTWLTAAYNVTYPERTPWTLISNGSGAGIANGATSMTVAAHVGWQIGDRLRFVDTRDLDTNTEDPVAKGNVNDERAITSIVGNVVSWTTGLSHAYTTARDHDSVVERFPMVANMTRDILIKSESAVGTRGHIIISDAGIANLDGVSFQDLGRTTTATLDPVTNHIGRYALHFHHSTSSDITAGTITNCVIERATKWGIVVHHSNYKRVTGTVVFDANGWGIGFEDGTEHHNVLDDNLVFLIKGTGDTAQDNTGISGMGFWMTGPQNFLHRNVAANTRAAAFGTFGSSGMAGCDSCLNFKLGAPYGRPFEDNEAIASSYALGFWGVIPNSDVDFRSIVYGFKEWHNQIGLYAYSLKNFYFINFYSRSDPDLMATRAFSNHNWFGDYAVAQISFWNADIQNKRVGMWLPYGNSTPIGTSSDERTVVFRNSTFHNLTDVLFFPNACACSPSTVPPMRYEFINTTHTNTTGIHFDKGYTGTNNLRNRWRVRVTNYQNNTGDNFEVYASQQAGAFAMVQSDGGSTLGSVDAGKSNANNLIDHGYSTYGEILPVSATTRARIADYVVPFPDTSTLSTSLAAYGHTFTLTATPNNPGGSINVPGNDTVTVDGTPTGSRGWGYLDADGRLLLLGVNGRWYYWNGSSFVSWGQSYSNPPGTYTIAASPSGTFLREDYHDGVVYKPYVVTSDHEIVFLTEFNAAIYPLHGLAARTGDSTSAARMSAGGRYTHDNALYNWDFNWCGGILTGQDSGGSLQSYAPNDALWETGAAAPACTLSGGGRRRRPSRLRASLGDAFPPLFSTLDDGPGASAHTP